LNLLVTGFEPFGGYTLNPSAAIAQELDQQEIAGVHVRTAILPVDSAQVGAAIQHALAGAQPVIVIALGLAAGRAALHVERVAVNVRDFAIADNSGARAAGEPVVSGGPDAYLASVPARSLALAIRAAGVPACVSDSAGTYVCNQTLYHLLHQAATWPHLTPAPRCGFIHVPCLPEQIAAQTDLDLGREGVPTMAFATMLTGVRAALVAAVESEQQA
jgi:pyroglutamyl-peptidase